MRKPERSSYTTLDFLQWHEAGNLIISPKFQRRGVWTRPAQSYLVDTLLLGLPVPPIYLRVVQDTTRKGTTREVIDGQQRLTALLTYMKDEFALSKNIETPCVGKRFSALAKEQKDAISQYSFVCEVFYGAEDREILAIFARLNTHAVKLNDQELRNGKFFGHFKQCAYDLALEHLEFWRRNHIFSEQAIARMQEAELTSELLVAMLAGMQDKKKSIDNFYQKYDETFPERADLQRKFRAVADALTESFSDEIPQTEFRRVPLFYSLFLAVYHRMFRLASTELPTPATGRLSRADQDGLQSAVRSLSDAITSAKEGVTQEVYSRFVAACLRQTDNLTPRTIRLEAIYTVSFL